MLQWAKVIMSMERSVPPHKCKEYLEAYSITVSAKEPARPTKSRLVPRITARSTQSLSAPRITASREVYSITFSIKDHREAYLITASAKVHREDN